MQKAPKLLNLIDLNGVLPFRSSSFQEEGPT